MWHSYVGLCWWHSSPLECENHTQRIAIWLLFTQKWHQTSSDIFPAQQERNLPIRFFNLTHHQIKSHDRNDATTMIFATRSYVWCEMCFDEKWCLTDETSRMEDRLQNSCLGQGTFGRGEYGSISLFDLYTSEESPGF